MAEGKPSSASQSLTPIALCRLKLQKFWNNVLKDITDKPKIWPNSIRSLTILHDRSKLDITDLPKIWLDSIRFLNISHNQEYFTGSVQKFVGLITDLCPSHWNLF